MLVAKDTLSRLVAGFLARSTARSGFHPPDPGEAVVDDAVDLHLGRGCRSATLPPSLRAVSPGRAVIRIRH